MAGLRQTSRRCEAGFQLEQPTDQYPLHGRSPARSIRLYGLNPRSNECLLATLNCSSIGGLPIVAQNKIPKSVAEKIMIATSLKYIGSTPH